MGEEDKQKEEKKFVKKFSMLGFSVAICGLLAAAGYLPWSEDDYSVLYLFKIFLKESNAIVHCVPSSLLILGLTFCNLFAYKKRKMPGMIGAAALVFILYGQCYKGGKPFNIKLREGFYINCVAAGVGLVATVYFLACSCTIKKPKKA